MSGSPVCVFTIGICNVCTGYCEVERNIAIMNKPRHRLICNNEVDQGRSHMMNQSLEMSAENPSNDSLNAIYRRNEFRIRVPSCIPEEVCASVEALLEFQPRGTYLEVLQ